MLIRKSAAIIAIGFIMLIANAGTVFSADVAKIGTVNFEKIFNNSAGGKAVKNQIKEEGRRMNADLDKIQKEIKDLKQMLGKDGSAGVMNESARENKQWELDRKVNEVKALKKRFDRKIQELQVKLINSVRTEVLGIMNDFGKKEGYLLIVEDLNVVYAPKHIDVTDKIIQLYNAQYAKK